MMLVFTITLEFEPRMGISTPLSSYPNLDILWLSCFWQRPWQWPGLTSIENTPQALVPASHRHDPDIASMQPSTFPCSHILDPPLSFLFWGFLAYTSVPRLIVSLLLTTRVAMPWFTQHSGLFLYLWLIFPIFFPLIPLSNPLSRLHLKSLASIGHYRNLDVKPCTLIDLFLSAFTLP